jgi:deoxyribonuclease V
VRLLDLHPWDLSPADAAASQKRLAPRVVCDPADVRLVAAADVAYVDPPRGRWGAARAGVARAAAVLLSYPGLDVVEQAVTECSVAFPYVPGLLSFREAPALSLALERLSGRPDLLLVDGQGYAHPRRFGIACHIGILAGIPTIGVAKSRLCGEHGPLPPEAGARVPLVDKDEVIGLALRTRAGVAPLYVSSGHLISLESAAAWTLRLCRGYRLPEPARLADRLSKGIADKEAPRPS